MTPTRATHHLSAHAMVAQQTHIQVKCLHECHMSCMKCHHAHIPSHSPTASHMHMPSVKNCHWYYQWPMYRALTGSSTQCKCQWATYPESILTPITQLEVYVINMTVCLLWATELFGSHRGSLTPMFQGFHLRGLTVLFLLRPIHLIYISFYALNRESFIGHRPKYELTTHSSTMMMGDHTHAHPESKPTSKSVMNSLKTGRNKV